MINSVTLAVLITLTYGGDLRVVEGLSDTACTEALCVARDGMTCAEHEVQQAAATKRLNDENEAWARIHPKEVSACEARNKSQTSSLTGSVITWSCRQKPVIATGGSSLIPMGPGDIKTAVCTTPAPKEPK